MKWAVRNSGGPAGMRVMRGVSQSHGVYPTPGMERQQQSASVPLSAVAEPRSVAPPAGLRLRKAGEDDAPALQFFFDTALRRDYFVRRGQLEELLTDGYHDVWIAELHGVLVGIAIRTRGVCLTNVLVHPAYRGLQIGAALIEATGATEVRAKVDMSAGDPRGFYRRLGFRPSGERNAKGNIEVLRRSAAGAEKQED
jgi:GNAT superfamily N-acetyltransferase